MSGKPTQTATTYPGHGGRVVSRIRLDWTTSTTSDAAAANSSSGMASLQPRRTSVSPITRSAGGQSTAATANSRAATIRQPRIGSPASNTVARWWNRPKSGMRSTERRTASDGRGLRGDERPRNGRQQGHCRRDFHPDRVPAVRAACSLLQRSAPTISTNKSSSGIRTQWTASTPKQLLQFGGHLIGRPLEHRVPTVERRPHPQAAGRALQRGGIPQRAAGTMATQKSSRIRARSRSRQTFPRSISTTRAPIRSTSLIWCDENRIAVPSRFRS